MFFYKTEKKHVFYVFYLQSNVFNIYALIISVKISDFGHVISLWNECRFVV